MSLIGFLKEFSEATEDIKEEHERVQKVADFARFKQKRRR